MEEISTPCPLIVDSSRTVVQRVPARRSCLGLVRAPTGSCSPCSRWCPGVRTEDTGRRNCVSWWVCCRCLLAAACIRHRWRSIQATSDTHTHITRSHGVSWLRTVVCLISFNHHHHEIYFTQKQNHYSSNTDYLKDTSFQTSA